MEKKYYNCHDLMQKKNLLNEYIVLSDDDTNIRSSKTIIHNKCGYKFIVKNLYSWVIGDRRRKCPLCDNGRVFTLNLIQHKLDTIYPKRYSIIEKNVDYNKRFLTKDRFLVKDNICGHEFLGCWDRFKQGNGCPKCGRVNSAKNNANRLTPEIIQNRLNNDKRYDEFSFLNLDDFKTVHDKNIIVQHNKCKRKFTTRIRNILYNKNLCPFCANSKMEKKLKIYLDDKNTEYYYHKKFNNLYGTSKTKKLEFDFEINNTLIEINGEFHYENTAASKMSGRSTEQILNDKIKVNYAVNNALNMIVIPYWEFDNIYDIIDIIITDSTTNSELINYNITIINNGNIIKELTVK